MTKEEFDNSLSKLKLASECYYNTDATIMTDAEYDVLIRKCREYASENNIKEDFLNSDVGFEVNGKQVVKHIKRMYSQKDIFNLKDMLTWVDKKKTKIFYTEPKLDGCSANLIYVGGKLKSIASRGDGNIGLDLTHLKDVIIGIPDTIALDEQIEIRGELIITYKNFLEFEDKFKNPRNMVAGSLSLLDVEEFKKRNIEFIPWGLGFTKRKMNKSELKPFLTKLGFRPMPYTNTISDISDINHNYKEIIKASKENSLTAKGKPLLDYPVDGMMVYINKHEEQSFYGYSNKFPLYSAAFKFPATETSTKLLGVDFNIGRDGRLTITGVLEPVELLGTTVSRATLHNLNYIITRDIRIGDKVIVYKAGDIVPAIKEPFINVRSGDEKIIKINKCPYCKTELDNNKGMLSCKNNECSGIIKSKLKFAVSKKCLNLDGIGDSFIEKMVDCYNIKHVADFYRLDSMSIFSALNPRMNLVDDVIRLEKRFKDKFTKAEEYYKTIQRIKNKPFTLVLESFSLPTIGNATCLRLEKLEITSMDDLSNYLDRNDASNFDKK